MFTNISINFYNHLEAKVQSVPYHEGIMLLRNAFNTSGYSLIQLIVDDLPSPWLCINNVNLYITKISREPHEAPVDIPEAAQSYVRVADEARVSIKVESLKTSFAALHNFVDPERRSHISIQDLIPAIFWVSEAARFEEVFHICLGLMLPELALYPDVGNWQLYRRPLLNEWEAFSGITAAGLGFSSDTLMVPVPAGTTSMFLPLSTYPRPSHPRTVVAAWEATGSFTCMTASEYWTEVEEASFSYGEAITTDVGARSVGLSATTDRAFGIGSNAVAFGCEGAFFSTTLYSGAAAGGAGASMRR